MREFSEIDRQMMMKALKLAYSVKGNTGDNPAVGAVLYKGRRVIATGKTHPPGRAHAEADALQKAGARAAGADLAVTLEPCGHVGRTGPCADAIIAAGVKRVVAATGDPNPRVNGRGFRRLRRAGLRVETGLMQAEARKLNEDYIKFITAGQPFVTLKAAMTLNGQIAANSGHSQWISSLPARRYAHALRAKNDAVLVGLNTVKNDDPKLTVRHVNGRNPLRVILSPGPGLPPRSYLARTAGRIPTMVVRPRRGRRVAIRAMLKELGRRGIKSLLVEGGSGVFTAFLNAACVDRIQLVLANKILKNGIPLVRGARTRAMGEGIRLTAVEYRKLGDDLLITGHPVFPGK